MPVDKASADQNRRQPASTGDRGALDHGRSFDGAITDYNPSSQVYSIIADSGEIVENAILALPIVSGIIGFKISMRLPVGTKVKFIYGNPAHIYSCIPSDVPDPAAWMSKVITGTGYPGGQALAHPDPDLIIPPNTISEDLYDGELEMGHLTGGFLRFLMFMTSLGSGERAKIECHLLRDLVRVISRNYEHFSSSGDFKIYDDGRNNVEMNGTTYEHERWGAMNEKDPRADLPGTGMPTEMVDPLETGRWRYTFLLGFIGDLFNGWFTDPAAVAGKMAADSLRSGKARLHVGQDGVILAQSCSEIVLEKVTRIMVPIRLKHEEDAKGVLRDEMSKLDREFLKTWDTGGDKSEHHTLFQIREYARYLNQYHSLARLHQMAALKQEWKIPSEEATPAPSVGADEDDREGANSGTTWWKECYATRRIMRDGSLLDYDAYGNCIATGPYGVQISSTRHIHHYAAGDIVLKAGGSLFMSGRSHVEIAAHRGSLIAKARTGWRALCERGTIFLKSDYDPDDEYSPSGNDPKPEVIEKQGIRIQATKGESRYISNRKSRFTVTKTEEALEFESKGDVNIYARKQILFRSMKDIMIHAGQDILTACRQWKVSAHKGMIIDGVADLSRGVVRFTSLLVMTLKAQASIAGPERVGRVKNDGAKIPLKAHTNHIDIYDGDPFTIDAEVDISQSQFPDEEPKVVWSLLTEDSYRWTSTSLGAKEDVDRLFEPLAQQHLATDTPPGYDVWSNMADDLLNGTETGHGAPWPAKSAQWLSQTSKSPPLGKPTGKEPSSFTASIQTALTPVSVKFRFLTR